MRIMGMIVATSALLAACGETRDDASDASPAHQNDSTTVQGDAPANQSAPAASPGNESANQGGAPVAETQAADKGAVRPDPAAPASANPCMVQDDKALNVAAVRGIGTEPFWNARVEGRCVTYSTPEDQKGTRIWTRFTPGPGGGTWSGKLDGRRFELRIRPQRDCSDGMSDKKYPLAAELVVGAQRRQGCAAPA